MFSCSNGHSVWVGGSTKFASTKNFAQMFRKKSEWNDCDSKLFMSFHVKWLKMLKLVGMRHCWHMVEAWTWWKCQFLTNLWNVEITPQKKNTFSHSSALANLPPTNASEKLLQIVGDLQIRQIAENVKMGWHAKLLANGWKMDMAKILKLVDMWDCWQIVEMWKWHTKRSLIAAANKVMTRTVGINSMFFHFPIPARQERCSAHPNSSCQPLHAHDVGAVWFLPPKPQTVLAKTYFHPSPIDERSLIVNMSTCDHVVCNKPWLD